MKPNRIEAFSDGVMAILITIMVLELKAPHDPTPASLARMWPTFFAYVLSFIIIAIYWVNHHYLIHLVSRVDAIILWANMNQLFWISLIPWVTVYLGDNHALPFPVHRFDVLHFLFHLFRQRGLRRWQALYDQTEYGFSFGVGDIDGNSSWL